jgi:hypothetical protein
VCPPLYKYSDIYSDYSEKFSENGVFQGYKGHKGHVSFSQLPSRVESGSSAQKYNFNSGSFVLYYFNDAKGNSFKLKFKPDQNDNHNDNCNLRSHIDEHFKQVFSSIGPTGAKIWMAI